MKTQPLRVKLIQVGSATACACRRKGEFYATDVGYDFECLVRTGYFSPFTRLIVPATSWIEALMKATAIATRLELYGNNERVGFSKEYPDIRLPKAKALLGLRPSLFLWVVWLRLRRLLDFLPSKTGEP